MKLFSNIIISITLVLIFFILLQLDTLSKESVYWGVNEC